MKNLYIVRGPFGTGKTTFAKSITENVVSCWDYYAKYGKNEWNEELKPHADDYCRACVTEMLEQGVERIAVTNSFSKNSDLDYYYDIAAKNDYQVFTIVMECHDAEKYKRNAPEDVVLKQIINLKNNAMFYHGY